LFLDVLEDLPRFGGDLVGEPLDVGRATGGIDHAVESAFLAEDRVEVAGDAAGELVGFAGDFVEGADVQAVHAGDHGGEGFGGDAQHVGVGVVGRLVPLRGGGVDVDGSVFDAVGGGHLAPEPACGADLGDFHEVIRADGEADADVGKNGGGRGRGLSFPRCRRRAVAMT
jgi:hypothetical protein